MENRDLDIGYVFEKTFSVVGERFTDLALLSLVFVGIPTIIIQWLSAQWLEQAVASGNMLGAFSPGFILASVLLGLLPFLLQAAVVHTTVETMARRPTDFGSSVSVALSVFLPLILLTILMSIGFYIGFRLLIVPGLILMTFWAVAVPAFVAERTGIIGAFGRSMALTEGQRWRIFALMVVAFVVMFVIMMILGMIVFAIMGGTQDYENFATFSLLGTLFEAAVNMAAYSVGAVGVSVLYVHLRELKDGSSAETLADVFR